MRTPDRFARRAGAAALAAWLAAAPAGLALADANFPPPMLPDASNATPNARTNLQLPALADQQPQVTDRRPTNSDFLFQNALWRYKGWVYQQQSATSGDPQWTLLNPSGSQLPGDASTAAVTGLYCLKQCKAGYSGNLFIAQGADATQVTVGQLSGGAPDLRTMFATLGNDQPIRIAKVFDQSGNANDAVQATAANQPALLIDKNGEPFIVFDAFTTAGGATSGATTTARTSFLTLPNTMSLTKDAISAYNIEEARTLAFNAAAQVPNLLLLGGGNSTPGLQLINFYNTGLTINGDGNGSSVSGGWTPAATHLNWLITSPSGRGAAVEGNPIYNKSGDLGATNLQGGTLGILASAPSGATIGPGFETAWRATAIYGSSLSAANDLAVRTALTVLYQTRPQARVNIAVAGESVSAAENEGANLGWLKQVQDGFPASVRIFAQGIQGRGVSANGTSGANSMESLGASMIDPIFKSGATANIAILFPGANDGWAGSPNTTADEIRAILAWVAARKAAGFNPVFVGTLIDRSGNGTQAAWLAAMSPLIRWNAAAGGYQVIDYQAIASIGAAGAASNATNFPDGIHPSSAAAIASLAAATRQALAPYISP